MIYLKNEIKEILDNLKDKNNYIEDYGYKYKRLSLEDTKILLYIIKENERLKQNQVKTLNRIKDFINCSKCEITEGNYCDTKHSQYWKMFKEFAEELRDKIKGININDYVYISKLREQELLNQEEQLDNLYKTFILDTKDELQEENEKLNNIIYKLKKKIEKQKHKMFKSHNKIALYILLDLEKTIEGGLK